jgi:hypothetical protein
MPDPYAIPESAWLLIQSALATDPRVRALDAAIARAERRLARHCPRAAFLAYEERVARRHLLALGIAFRIGVLMARRFSP